MGQISERAQSEPSGLAWWLERKRWSQTVCVQVPTLPDPSCVATGGPLRRDSLSTTWERQTPADRKWLRGVRVNTWKVPGTGPGTRWVLSKWGCYNRWWSWGLCASSQGVDMAFCFLWSKAWVGARWALLRDDLGARNMSLELRGPLSSLHRKQEPSGSRELSC